MFKKNGEADEQLDRVGTAVLRAAAAEEAEIESAAATPFLYTRVRAAIAEQQSRDDAAGWLSLLFVARRAIPGMALLALFVGILTLWSSQLNAPAPGYRLDDEALVDTRDPGIEQTILANRNSLSQDEIFSIIVEQSEREQR